MTQIKATLRQQQVLNAMCRLGNVKRVAQYLDIQPRSVEAMLSRVRMKYGYSERILLLLDWDRQQRNSND